MSQYPFPPPPYVPPIVGSLPFEAPEKLLGPAKIAGLLQIIIGAFLTISAILALARLHSGPPDDKLAELQQQQNTQLMQITGMSKEDVQAVVQAMAYIFLAGVLIVGAALLLLAAFVRRGGWISAILSILINGIIAAALGFELLGGLVMYGADPRFIVPVIGILTLCGATLAKLVRAIGIANRVSALRKSQQLQWMMVQQGEMRYSSAQSMARTMTAAWNFPQPPTGPQPPAKR